MSYRKALAPTLLLFFIAGCARPPAITGELELDMNPSGRTPLAGLLTFTTDQPARATLTISDGENTSTVTPNDAFVTEHELMVLGLRPGRLNTVEVQIQNERGEAGEPATTSVQTEPLPDYFPPVDVRLSRPAAMEPGLTMITFGRTINQEFDAEFGLFLAIDAQGDVVWWYESDHELDEPRRLPNGNLLYQDWRTNVVEIDMLGNIVNRWHATGTKKPIPEGAIPVATNSFHHDVLEMPSGNILALSTEARAFENYPASEENPEEPWAPGTVIGDVLVEFQRDGTKVREWKFFDLLDAYRIGYNSLNKGFYRDVYSELLEDSGFDWAHTNTVVYDEAADSVIVSVKHQSTIMKLNLGSGEIEWLLGDPIGWNEPWSDLLLEPIGDVTWSYQHHAPDFTPDGTLLVFDNGAFRTIPPEPPLAPRETYSRAVEYRIDEAAGTVEEVWSYGGHGEDWFFSSFVCEADWLPQTDNILITVGGQVTQPDGTPGGDPYEGHIWVTLMEVTHTTPAEKVWEVLIDDPAVSWSVYRTERLPSLYP